MCNPTTTIVFIAKALHQRREARIRLHERARPQETDNLTAAIVRRPLPLDADASINMIGAPPLSDSHPPEPPRIPYSGQEGGWEWSVQAQGWQTAGREMVLHQDHALPALSLPLHHDVGARDPWPVPYASVSGRELPLRDERVEDMGRMMGGMRISDERLRNCDARRKQRVSNGWDEDAFERGMRGLRISDRGRGRVLQGGGDNIEVSMRGMRISGNRDRVGGGEDDLEARMGGMRISVGGRERGAGEEEFGRRMGALRISDAGRERGGESGGGRLGGMMRGLRISDVGRERVPQGEGEDDVERIRRMKIF